jgi:DNA-directed RNA polymerase specialized sigma24 family protein
VADPSDVEDIVQEVFYELVEANRLLMPIEHVTGWLFRVARNRITDLFRKRREGTFSARRPGTLATKTARCSASKTCCRHPMPDRKRSTSALQRKEIKKPTRWSGNRRTNALCGAYSLP